MISKAHIRFVLFMATAHFAASISAAQEVVLQDVIIENAPDETRIIFQCSGEVNHSAILTEGPYQILLYLRDTVLGEKVQQKLVRELKGKLQIEKWMDNPAVLQVLVPLAKKRSFDIENSDGTVVLHIAENGKLLNGSTTENAAPLPKRKANVRVSQPNLLYAKLSAGTPISVDFREAEIADVLRMLGRQNSLNIVTSDSVKGTITVTLHDVTVEQALESILLANGYKFVIQNGIILVKPGTGMAAQEVETRIYRLRYMDAHNVKEAITDLISTEGKIKVLTTSFHNREDIYDINKNQQPVRERRYWLRSSVLLVTDYPSVLKAIDALIEEIDVPVPQIMIEAKLIEAAPQHNSQIGIDWSKSIAAELFNEIVLDGGGVYRYSTQSPLPNKNDEITVGTLNTTQFNAVLNYLKSKTNTRLLSNPRILAMDNEPSDIAVGTNFPIPQINRGVGGQGDIVTFSYKDVNITLRVIPHVTEDNFITMYVNPIIEEVTGQVTVDKNFAPITSKREVDTVVKVRNGDTIVIGGMIKEKELVTIDKVWLLGDIPLLGYFFRNKNVQKQQTDLLIFITPRIVSAE